MAGPAVIAWRLAALLSGAGFAAALAVYPWREHGLWAVLALYAAAVLWRPRLWLSLMLALLPVLDLAPLTGWFFLEELDLLLLLACACGYWRLASASAAPLPLSYGVSLGLLVLVCLGAMVRGLLPWQPLDLNSFNNYLSPMNALRVGKPWLWLPLLLPLLRRTVSSEGEVRRYLLPGLLTGLFLVACAAIAERYLFPGLSNFSADYRISAPFSAMHTGGAALDGYLALTLPLLLLALQTAAPRWRILLLGLLLLALYTVLATFSRGLYAGMVVAALLLALPGAMRMRRHGAAAQLAALLLFALAILVLHQVFILAGYRSMALVLAMLLAAGWLAAHKLQLASARAPTWMAALLCAAIVVPVASSEYAGVRTASIASDLQGRLRHWHSVLALVDHGWLGMGMGRFPAQYYWNNPAREQPAAYRYLQAGQERSLELLGPDYRSGYGEVLRMLQRVQVQPYTPYVLRLDVRNAGPLAFLRPGLCERQLLYPQNCLRLPMVALPTQSGWRQLELAVQTGPLTPHAPVQLELAVEGQRAHIVVDNVSLYDPERGRELLRNGDFSALQEHWFFSSDHHHLPWHIKNLALNLYFETGVAGLLAFAVLMWSALAVLLRRPHAAAWLASLAAFLTVGLFDSLLDVPRITLLFLLLLSASQLRPCIKREVMPGSSQVGKKNG